MNLPFIEYVVTSAQPMMDHSFLEPCKPIPTAACPAPATKKKGKQMSRYYDEENDRYLDALPTQSDAATARSHLLSRVWEVSSEIDRKLARTFGLLDDEAPETFADAIARIKKGQYVIPDRFKETDTVYAPLSYLKWRDPSVKADKAGYKAASKELEKARQETIDEISVKSPEDGLKALRKLEQFKA